MCPGAEEVEGILSSGVREESFGLAEHVKKLKGGSWKVETNR